MIETKPVLELTGISKRFGAVQALTDVDIQLFAGEVHALVGENGAGKSTLVKILAGNHRPDAGRMKLGDQELVLSGPAAARHLGIAVIHQHPNLFPDLTVAENVFVGRLPRNRVRAVDWGDLNRKAERLFANLGVKQSVSVPVRGLSVADQPDGVPVEPRGGKALHDHQTGQGPRHGDPVRRPPHGGGLRDRR